VYAEDYTTEQQAVAHVRRLLDIVACTTAFAKHKSSKHGRPATPPSPPASASAGAAHGGVEAPPPISEAHDMAAIRPPPKLAEFYDFFSFAHLTPPLHCKAVCPDEAPHLLSFFCLLTKCGLRFCSYQEEGEHWSFSGRRLLRNRGNWNSISFVSVRSYFFLLMVDGGEQASPPELSLNEEIDIPFD
jgi:hypothetical protein